MTDYDFLITNFFHQFSNSQVNFFLTIVANLVYVVLLYFLLYFFRKNKKKQLYLLLISGIVGIALTTALKYFINRPRPFPQPADFLDILSGSSFPSRHSFLAGLAVYFLPKELSKKIRNLYKIYFLIIVPLSLLIIGAHYITDIVAGLGIGYLLPPALDKILGNKTFVKRPKKK